MTLLNIGISKIGGSQQVFLEWCQNAYNYWVLRKSFNFRAAIKSYVFKAANFYQNAT